MKYWALWGSLLFFVYDVISSPVSQYHVLHKYCLCCLRAHPSVFTGMPTVHRHQYSHVLQPHNSADGRFPLQPAGPSAVSHRGHAECHRNNCWHLPHRPHGLAALSSLKSIRGVSLCGSRTHIVCVIAQMLFVFPFF